MILLRRLALVAAGLVALAAGTAEAARFDPVNVSQLPAFAGGDCTTTSGSVAISCATLLGRSNTFGAQQSLKNLRVFDTSASADAPAGLETVVNGKLVQIGANIGDFGTVQSGLQSGFIRMDTRGGGTIPLYSFFGATTPNPTGGYPALMTLDPVLGLKVDASIAPGPAENSNKLDTTANSQNRLSHVANMTAVAGWVNTAFPVEVDGTVTANDGGRRKMTFDSSNKCGAGGHPAADGYTCVNSTVVTTGSWNIDWASVDNEATPLLFESFPAVTHDEAAIQAAVNTGLKVHLPDMFDRFGRYYQINSDIILGPASQTQVIYGDGRIRTRIYSGPAAGFSKGMFQISTYEPGPNFRDFGVFYNQPDSTDPTTYTTYVPTFIAPDPASSNVSGIRGTFEHLGCYRATICFQGLNNKMAGDTFFDVQMMAYKYGADIDDAADQVSFIKPHWGPFLSTANQNIAFQASGAIGLHLGRIDDLKITGGTFFGGQGVTIAAGAGTADSGQPGFGEISNNDFDNYCGLSISAGTEVITGNIFTMGQPNCLSLYIGTAQSNVTVSGNSFANTLATASSVTMAGGVANFTGNTFGSGAIDNQSFTQTGGDLILSSNFFNKPVGTYTKGMVSLSAGHTTYSGNVFSPFLQANGTPVSGNTSKPIIVSNDSGFSKAIGNTSIGWAAWVPSSPLGVYQAN